jgi:hypothetical protein
MVGFLSDEFSHGNGPTAASLRLALLVLAPTGFWAMAHFFFAMRTIVKDQKRANEFSDETPDADVGGRQRRVSETG